MKIYLIGKEGMLGRTFCKLLQNDFFATARSDVDVTDAKKLLSIVQREKPTHLINCTAFTDVDGAEDRANEAHLINVEAVENLALIAKENDCKLIHFSTDYVFDGLKKEPYLENDPCHPLSVYGKTKREGEKIALDISPENLIIRTSWLFGDGKRNFVEVMKDALEKNAAVHAVSDQIGRPTFCDDLAKATLSLLNCSGIFHFANSGETTRFGWVNQIQHLLRLQKEILPAKTEDFPAKAERPAYSVLSTCKYEKIGGKPRPWQEALKEYLQC